MGEGSRDLDPYTFLLPRVQQEAAANERWMEQVRRSFYVALMQLYTTTMAPVFPQLSFDGVRGKWPDFVMPHW
jgi:adenylate cyclase